MTPAPSGVLGLIPARGGSKGIPRKNIRPLLGRPLLAYTADAALAARWLTHVALTTEDDEIASVGRACGLDVPFMRPRELAADATPMLPVVQHAVRWFDDHGRAFGAVCLLQPTNPLRRAEDIDRCIELFEETGADSVMTVLSVPAEHNPHWVYFREADGSMRLSTGDPIPIPRRQDLPPAFHREGSVYVTRRHVLLVSNSLYGSRTLGVVMNGERSVNIDDPDDWRLAEARLASTP